MHRHDGAVFQPEACNLVGDDIEPGLAGLSGDRSGQRGVSRQIVVQILDHIGASWLVNEPR